MKKIVIAVIIIVIVAIVVAALFMAMRIKGSAKLVQVDRIKKRTIESTVIAFGRVEPKSDVNISAEVSEKIEKIYVDEGDTVKVGDVLVRLNRDRFIAAVNRAQAQVNQVQANLKKARDNLSKIEQLKSSGAVSDDALIAARTEVDVLSAQLESAMASLREAQDNLSQTIIKSPLDGIVTSLTAEEGEFVIVGTMNNPGSVIMTIAQLTNMQATVDVDEADVVDIVPGQKAKLELDAIPDTSFDGTVLQVAHQAKVQSLGGEETRATFEVKISIDNPSPKIRPGMSVTATITIAQHDSVPSAPISAIVEYHNTIENKKGEGIFTVENGTAKKVQVHTGISDDRFIEIIDGVNVGDIIIKGPFKVLRELKDGDRVKYTEETNWRSKKGKPPFNKHKPYPRKPKRPD